MSELKSRIIDALKQVYDPEIPINVWDLGLIYKLEVSGDGKVFVRLTLTSPTCPVAGQVISNIVQTIQLIPGVKDVDAELVFDPPWNLTMVTPEGRELLKQIYGRDIVEEYIKEQSSKEEVAKDAGA